MSVVWAWLQTAVSYVLAGTGTMYALIGAGFVAVGLLVLTMLIVRRRTRAQRRARAEARGLPPSAEAAPGPLAVPVAPPQSEAPGVVLSSPLHVAPGQSEAPEVAARPRVAPDDAHWTRGAWHVTSGPTSTPPARTSGVPTVPLAPATPVAVAERPPVTHALHAAVSPWAPALDVPATTLANTLPGASTSAAEEELAEREYGRGLELLSRTDGQRAEKLREALACLRRAQEVWTRERAPERWAVVQNDIARVYQELPDGDRATNLRTAIMHHQAALEVFDPVQHAMNWAWTQAALGAAYLSLPSGSAIANARAAVAYYQRALDIFTQHNAPLAWAWNQNNLGAAYETMRGGGEGERVAHLRDAEQAYAAALEVYTAAEHTAQHALVTRNLARVRAELASLE